MFQLKKLIHPLPICWGKKNCSEADVRH